MQPLATHPIETKTLTEFVEYAAKFGVNAIDAAEHYRDIGKDEVFTNDNYLVIRRPLPKHMNPYNVRGIFWLSIRRVDAKTVRNWADLQEIKNQLLGVDAEAIEIFPAESRKTDACNQYHLFGGSGWKAPFGFPEADHE